MKRFFLPAVVSTSVFLIGFYFGQPGKERNISCSSRKQMVADMAFWGFSKEKSTSTIRMITRKQLPKQTPISSN